jgi:HPt (histidine-containing phosphotransfer) domain-containing protein
MTIINQRENKIVLNAPPMENVCDFGYIIEILGNKRQLIREIMETFVLEIPKELHSINGAVASTDYPAIRNVAHSMKSSVSIMGVSVLTPILQEMEELGTMATGIQRIEQLNQKLNLLCKKAVDEVEKEKNEYV